MDTGSDVIRVQCQPCNMCYKHADPVFNPTTSASYTDVLCGSPACNTLLVNERHCHTGKCGYEVNYVDGSYTKGTLMLETLTFKRTRILNLAMGFGHNNQGLFNLIAGLLDLGGGRMSFINQILETGGGLRYCLPSYNSISPCVVNIWELSGWSISCGCYIGTVGNVVAAVPVCIITTS
ncbi:hypothetical protein LWI28_017090 [Acer negundo]|uniref:Peptidase A1 domain-containing protein n=1 Tax=Acer negundo TaxID=4023 RepID=A0AAD5ISI9_ACENE|nr:hypothetical protein LWI28_017090 [Acer negundo]